MKWVVIMLQFSKATNICFLLLSTPIPPTLLYKEFTLSPETSTKYLRILFNTTILWVLVSQKKMMSSANCNMSPFTSFYPTFNTFIDCFISVCLINFAKPLATIKYKKGATGPPCLLTFLMVWVHLPDYHSQRFIDDSRHSLIQ